MSEKDRTKEKHDFQILFRDSSEYFPVKNARMIQEGLMVRFIRFDENDNYLQDVAYPIFNIHRVETILKKKENISE